MRRQRFIYITMLSGLLSNIYFVTLITNFTLEKVNRTITLMGSNFLSAKIMNPKIEIIGSAISDYDNAVEFWSTIEGVTLNESDTQAAIGLFLVKNPDSSFIAEIIEW